jgi:urea transport system ATP-binding protein
MNLIGGLQPSVVLDIERAVRRIIKATGISVLLVEQHLHFVRQADRYYAMQRCGIVASGPASELSKDVGDRFLYAFRGREARSQDCMLIMHC